MSRRIKLGIIALVALPLVCGGVLAWVLGTASGARVALQVATAALPGLSVRSIEGRLIGPLSLSGIEFENETLRLKVGSAKIRWSPRLLAEKQLRIDELRVANVEFTQLRSPPTPEDEEPFRLPDSLDLPIAITLSHAQLLQFQYRASNAAEAQAFVIDSATIAASYKAEQLQLSQLDISAPLFSVRAKGSSETRGDYSSELALDWELRLPDYAAVKGAGSLQGGLSTLHFEQTISAPYNLTLTGLVRDALGEPTFSGQLHARAPDLPAINTSLPRLNLNATVAAEGDLGEQNFDTEVSMRSEIYGDIKFSSRGRLRDQLLHLEQLLVTRANTTMQLKANGEIDLGADNPSMDLQTKWSALQWPLDTPTVSSSTGGAHIEGNLENYSVELAADLALVDQAMGSLRLRGRGRGKNFELEALSLISGPSTVSASGTVGESLDLSWSISSPDLATLVPESGGSLNGKGSIAGSWRRPVVLGQLRGEQLYFRQFVIQNLALDANVDLQRDAPSTFSLQVGSAEVAGVSVSSVQVRGNGTRLDHRIDIAVDSSEGKAKLQLAGSLGEDAWSVAIDAGELQFRNLAAWQLVDIQTGEVSAERQSLGRGCWASRDARLCLQAERTADFLRADLDVAKLAFTYFEPLLQQSIDLSGELSGAAKIYRAAGFEPSVEVRLDSSAGQLRVPGPPAEDIELVFDLDPLGAELHYSEKGLVAKIDIPFSNSGVKSGIFGELAIDSGSQPLAERPLRGKLKLDLNTIAFAGIFSPEIERVEGRAEGGLDVVGSIASPEITGKVSLSGAQIALLTPQLEVTDVALDLHSRGSSGLSFTGAARSGGGDIKLVGSAQLGTAAADSTANVQITGEQFQVIDTADARVFVSPDLKIAVSADRIDINGDLKIPRAQITPRELPTAAVAISPDQVIVGNSAEEDAQPAAGPAIYAKIRLQLGDQVTIDGFGFKGGLNGQLAVVQAPGKPTIGSGELTIRDGEYRAYGQGLVIEKGVIVFAGGPIDQPGINVRAVRRPASDIVVGVRVRGPLQQPEFNLYSEPSMGQSEQLSWLVLGRPLDNASDAEGSLLTQAAMALGLRGGDFLAGRLGDNLGVDSIGFESGSGEAGAASDVNQAAFVIGKYLSPKLYVSYGIGLFNSISTVKLDYSINDNWKVSTESSTVSSSGDIIYTIER